MRRAAHLGIIQRAQHRRRPGVHHQQRHVAGPGSGDGQHARHAGRDLAGQVAELVQPGPPLDLLCQVLEAKAAVADARGRGTMVEDRHRNRVERLRDPEGPQRCGDRIGLEIAELDAAGGDPGQGTLIDHLDPHGLHPLQVVVKGARGVRGGEHLKPLLQVGFDRPVARTATHGHPGQEQVDLVTGRLAYLGRHQHGGRGHDHLDRILDRGASLEDQDVLRSRAYVDGQDPWRRHEPERTPTPTLPSA